MADLRTIAVLRGLGDLSDEQVAMMEEQIDVETESLRNSLEYERRRGYVMGVFEAVASLVFVLAFTVAPLVAAAFFGEVAATFGGFWAGAICGYAFLWMLRNG